MASTSDNFPCCRNSYSREEHIFALFWVQILSLRQDFWCYACLFNPFSLVYLLCAVVSWLQFIGNGYIVQQNWLQFACIFCNCIVWQLSLCVVLNDKVWEFQIFLFCKSIYSRFRDLVYLYVYLYIIIFRICITVDQNIFVNQCIFQS